MPHALRHLTLASPTYEPICKESIPHTSEDSDTKTLPLKIFRQVSSRRNDYHNRLHAHDEVCEHTIARASSIMCITSEKECGEYVMYTLGPRMWLTSTGYSVSVNSDHTLLWGIQDLVKGVAI